MKLQERFDKILTSAAGRIQDEVSALIGKSFKVGLPRFSHIDKKTLFDDLIGKQVLAHIRVDGDIQGTGCLLIGIKDAIHIGGTLIMLPESELESTLREQEYSEEIQDSYGEVANIICGAITVAFEEQYTKSIRLIRTEQEIVLPAKIDMESDQPIADIPYYQLSLSMTLDGRPLDNLYLLLPAEPFGLVEPSPKGQPAVMPDAAPEKRSESSAEEEVGVLARERDDGDTVEEVGVLERAKDDGLSQDAQETPATPRKRDVGKQKKLIDALLKNSWAKMSDEVSTLLGGALKVTPTENLAVTKEMFLDQAGSKQIMTRMALRSGAGEAYLFVDLKSAVYLGGCLIMLPESELEETVRNETFGDDARDAYGEVTNIVAGVFTAVFEEQYRGKIGFVKTDLEPVTPTRIDPDSDEVFVNQGYYLAVGQLRYNEQDLGRVQFLVPAHVFELEELFLAVDEPVVQPSSGRLAAKGVKRGRGEIEEPDRLRGQSGATTDMLIVTDDDGEAERIADVLAEKGFSCRILHFKDPINTVLTPRIQMIFLVMREVCEQGFGVAIKISSSGFPVPLVAAGPAWTRTMVLKAVKYGACDILITPSTSEDILEKIADHLVKKAA